MATLRAPSLTPSQIMRKTLTDGQLTVRSRLKTQLLKERKEGMVMSMECLEEERKKRSKDESGSQGCLQDVISRWEGDCPTCLTSRQGNDLIKSEQPPGVRADKLHHDCCYSNKKSAVRDRAHPTWSPRSSTRVNNPTSERSNQCPRNSVQFRLSRGASAREVNSIRASNEYAGDGEKSSHLCPLVLIGECQEDYPRRELTNSHERDIWNCHAAALM